MDHCLRPGPNLQKKGAQRFIMTISRRSFLRRGDTRRADAWKYRLGHRPDREVTDPIFQVACNHRVLTEYPDVYCDIRGRLQPHPADIVVGKLDADVSQPP